MRLLQWTHKYRTWLKASRQYGTDPNANKIARLSKVFGHGMACILLLMNSSSDEQTVLFCDLTVDMV